MLDDTGPVPSAPPGGVRTARLRLRRHLGGPLEPAAARAAVARPPSSTGVFAVCLPGGSGVEEQVGSVFLDRHRGALELSYQLLPAWWRRGMVTEACAAVLDLAADELAGRCPVDERVVVTQLANVASGALFAP